MSDALGYYKILQVSEDSDAETIKKAYRDLAKKWHPDYNHDQESTDIFQKISSAYNVLENPESRRIYDILSLVYHQNNYPDTKAMEPVKDFGNDVNLRMVNLNENVAWGLSYRNKHYAEFVSYKRALYLSTKTAVVNWLLGWWHPKSVLTNIKALINNFKHPVCEEESLRALIFNMIAYAQKGKTIAAAVCGAAAKQLLGKRHNKALDEFLDNLNITKKRAEVWNINTLRAAQLVIPVLGIIAMLLFAAAGFLNNSKTFWNLFSTDKEIDYYQKVDFGAKGQTVDDVVVGKIISIPVDKSDNSKLYHVTTETKVMYGPSDDFDSIKTLPKATTVRLTGITPDNIWARIMIDNGEIGFARFKFLKSGVGKEIPFGSAIIE